MIRNVTQHELDRRAAVAAGVRKLTDAMECGPSLTAVEWMNVFHTLTARMIALACLDEWKENRNG